MFHGRATAHAMNSSPPAARLARASERHERASGREGGWSRVLVSGNNNNGLHCQPLAFRSCFLLIFQRTFSTAPPSLLR